MPVSQKDIALSLGVDRSSVAHALRGDPRVSEVTRLRVIEEAKRLGYDAHTNAGARSMAAKRYGKRTKTDAIAVLLGDYVDGLPLQDLPFFREILQGIHAEAEANGIEVSMHVSRQNLLPRSLQSASVDGAIVIYNRSVSAAVRAQPLSVPVVHLGSDTQDWNIRPDDREGTYRLTQHLIGLGHRRIAYIGALNGSNEERQRGYHEAMAQAGLEIEPQQIKILDTASIEGGREGWHTFAGELEAAGIEPYTAVVCINDAAAVGVLEGAHDLGLRVPDDLSITGFDGLRDGYGGCPILTTASFDRQAMGRRAVKMILETGEQENATLPREILPVRLLERGSTAVPSK